MTLPILTNQLLHRVLLMAAEVQILFIAQHTPNRYTSSLEQGAETHLRSDI